MDIIQGELVLDHPDFFGCVVVPTRRDIAAERNLWLERHDAVCLYKRKNFISFDSGAKLLIASRNTNLDGWEFHYIAGCAATEQRKKYRSLPPRYYRPPTDLRRDIIQDFLEVPEDEVSFEIPLVTSRLLELGYPFQVYPRVDGSVSIRVYVENVADARRFREHYSNMTVRTLFIHSVGESPGL